MQDTGFFSPIPQNDFTSGGFPFCVPCFYYDTTSIQVTFLAPIQGVKALLPSHRFFPLPVTFTSTLAIITAFQYRKSDIGPYNEVAILFPVTLGSPARPFLGLQQFIRDPYIYIWQLPVTTEIARYGGVEFFNFPKFIADIDFSEDDTHIQCRLAEGEKEIFTLKVRKPALSEQKRSRMNALTIREGRILRTEIITSAHRVGSSSRKEDIAFTLGNHPIADNLRKLPLGRVSSYDYTPKSQSVLTGALESYPAS